MGEVTQENLENTCLLTLEYVDIYQYSRYVSMCARLSETARARVRLCVNVRACMYVRVRACARARACVRVCVCM